MPLGYDAGMYRYLFLQYSAVDSWLAFPILPSWTNHHSPLILWIIGRLVHIGMSVDIFLGIGWAITCIACIFAYMHLIQKKFSTSIAIISVGFCILSFAIYNTYTLMYWKTMPAAVVLVYALHALEHKKIIVAAILGVVLAGLHTQTAFLLALIALPWWFYIGYTKTYPVRTWALLSIFWVMIVLIALIWYKNVLPWVLYKLTYMVKGVDLSPGAFVSVPMAFKYSIGVGVFGYLGLFIHRKIFCGTIFHWSVIVTTLYTCSNLYFHRRFFIQLDWLLIPFAAYGLQIIWQAYNRNLVKICCVVLLIFQFWFGNKQLFAQSFSISPAELTAIKAIQAQVQPTGYVLVPENKSPFFAQGWLPNTQVIAPELLNNNLTANQWSKLIFGVYEAKKEILQTLPSNTTLLLLPTVSRAYGEVSLQRLIQNPCFKQIENTYLYSVVCQ